jgi:hypothetical protein
MQRLAQSHINENCAENPTTEETNELEGAGFLRLG